MYSRAYVKYLIFNLAFIFYLCIVAHMKNIIIFDLDGTLANCEHRLHYLSQTPKDWRGFFAECGRDTPIDHTIRIFKAVGEARIGAPYYQRWIVSGRSDECRAQTEKWLSKHIGNYDHLIMRKAGDHTDDAELKISWLRDGTIPKEKVLCIFEDRKRVVDAWRTEGLPVYHVAEGDF